MAYKILDDWEARGTSLLFTGPGLSARMRKLELIPRKGSRAAVRMSTPIPPSQWVKDRQNSSPMGSPSMAVRMVAPVVVKPEMVSKKQSINGPNRPENQKGSAPNTPNSTQIRPTVKKPSRAKKSGLGLNRNTGTAAAARMMRMALKNGMGLSP